MRLTSASTGWFVSFTYKIIQAYLQAVKWYPSEIPTDNFPDFDDMQIESLPSAPNETHLSSKNANIWLDPCMTTLEFVSVLCFSN